MLVIQSIGASDLWPLGGPPSVPPEWKSWVHTAGEIHTEGLHYPWQWQTRWDSVNYIWTDFSLCAKTLRQLTTFPVILSYCVPFTCLINVVWMFPIKTESYKVYSRRTWLGITEYAKVARRGTSCWTSCDTIFSMGGTLPSDKTSPRASSSVKGWEMTDQLMTLGSRFQQFISTLGLYRRPIHHASEAARIDLQSISVAFSTQKVKSEVSKAVKMIDHEISFRGRCLEISNASVLKMSARLNEPFWRFGWLITSDNWDY